MKRTALIILASLGYLFVLGFWRKLSGKNNAIRIIRYHSISDCRRHEVNVKLLNFKRQMRYLRRYYHPISLQEALVYLRNNSCIPERSVVVTFDDGYKDNFTDAFPVLRRLQIPATIFLVAGYIGTDKILPHDIKDNPLHNHLLSWPEVKKMQQGGVEFGSHTLSHANLGKENIDIQREVMESKRIIEKELNTNIWAISYPFGLLHDFNHGAKEAARAAGYTCGCSAMNGVNDTKTDIFELRRIGIEASDNMFTFRAKLNGALDLLIIKDKPVFNKLLNRFNRLMKV